MKCATVEVFPGLNSLISPERFQRVDRAVQALFSKTLQSTENGLPFIITGDIPAMWLRDSTWQVKPLLKSQHPDVISLLTQLSKSQIQLFLKDPYANAFNPEPNGNCWHRDFPDQSPWVFERKFELDSWASILYLARKIQENFGITQHLDSEFTKALDVMFELARREQNHDSDSYIFKRKNNVPHDSLSHDGHGAPVGRANVPSLLSLPYLEVLPASDPNYLQTREFILSKKNPYFFSGTKAMGIGSQHTPANHVWPIAIAVEALTSINKDDRAKALDLLENTDAGTGFMHESFNVNDDSQFTREWFSWSDMTYVDLVLESVDYKN